MCDLGNYECLVKIELKNNTALSYNEKEYLGFIVWESDRTFILKYFKYSKITDSIIFGSNMTIIKNDVADITCVDSSVIKEKEKCFSL